MSNGHRSKSKHKEEPRCELKVRTILASAVENFVRTNSNFESSVPITACVEELLTVSTVNDLFPIPLRHRIFKMNTALLWVMFLVIAPERAVHEGEPPFASGGYSATDSMRLLASVYDNGTQGAVWEHFEQDDDDDDDDEEEEESEKTMVD